MGCIRAMRVLAIILTVDDAEIRRCPRATALNTLSRHTGFTRSTDPATCAAVHTVCLQISRLDAIDTGGSHAAAVCIAVVACVLANA